MQGNVLHWNLLLKAVDQIQPRDFNGYFELKHLLANRDVAARNQFQILFAKYYGLHTGGLTATLKERYFELLFGFARPAETDPYTALLLDLYRLPNRRGRNCLQGSFVSKLIAIYDESRPIYDVHVSRFFGLNAPSIGPIEFRIAGFVANLEIIRMRYAAWAAESQFDKLTARLFQKHPALQACHSVRLCDFLVWAVGHYRIK